MSNEPTSCTRRPAEPRRRLWTCWCSTSAWITYRTCLTRARNSTGTRFCATSSIGHVAMSWASPSTNHDTLTPSSSSRTTATAQPTSPPLTPPLDSVSITLDVVLNRKTTLSTLYEHPLHAYVEYPQISAEHDRPVGHLFRLDPNKWRTPEVDFAYSHGAPTGWTQIGKEVYCRILVDQNTGTEVPCSERHSTCT